MPVSTIRTTAQEALDSFRSELTQVFYRLAEGNGTPYPPALVTDETDARRVVPGSLFLLKDGTFGWTGTNSAVRTLGCWTPFPSRVNV